MNRLQTSASVSNDALETYTQSSPGPSLPIIPIGVHRDMPKGTYRGVNGVLVQPTGRQILTCSGRRSSAPWSEYTMICRPLHSSETGA